MSSRKVMYFILMLVLVVLGCNRSTMTVTVFVDGADDAGIRGKVRYFQITPILNGNQKHWAAKATDGVPSPVDVVLPQRDSGILVIELQGMDGGRCQVTIGRSEEIKLTGAQSYQVRITLVPEEGCRLVLEVPPAVRTGSGIVSTDAGSRYLFKQAAMCQGICKERLPSAESQVTLSATPDADSYFAGWLGDCQGVGRCTLTISERVRRVQAVFLKRIQCHQDGWCWENPLPHGQNIVAFSGLGPNDVWAVGQYGTIQRWNGSFWMPYESGTREMLNGVFARTAKDVWVVGRHRTALHFDGERFVAVSGPDPCTEEQGNCSFEAVWAAAANDVWIVGQKLACHHYRGGLRLEQAGQCGAIGLQEQEGIFDFYVDIWGTGSNDIWAAGYKRTSGANSTLSLLRHYQGDSWRSVELPQETLPLEKMWGRTSDDLWLVGNDGFVSTIIHYDGHKASLAYTEGERTELGAHPLRAVHGVAKDDIWFGGRGSFLRYSQGRWFHQDSGQRGPVESIGVLALFATGPTDLWAGGLGGLLTHYDGSSWFSPGTQGRSNLQSISGATIRGEVFLRAVGTPPFTWVKDKSFGGWGPIPDSSHQCATWGTWVSGGDGIWKLDGYGKPNTLPSRVRPRTFEVYCGIWGSHVEQDVWFVGAETNAGYVLHYQNGQFFNPVKVSNHPLRAIWGSAADDIWASGDAGTLLHYDGKAWSPMQGATPSDILPVDQLLAIWGRNKEDVWIAGGSTSLVVRTQEAKIWHNTGKGFSALPKTNLAGPYVSVVGSGSRIIFGGPRGIDNLRWDGRQWQLVLGEVTNPVTGLWAAENGEVYAVGSAGTILVLNQEGGKLP